jgi:hypothetical protein
VHKPREAVFKARKIKDQISGKTPQNKMKRLTSERDKSGRWNVFIRNNWCIIQQVVRSLGIPGIIALSELDPPALAIKHNQ